MELRFPSKETPAYTWLDYEIEKKLGTYPGSEGSFCRTYMETLERVLNDCTGSHSAYISTTVKGTLNAGMEAVDLLTGHNRGKNGPQYDHMKERCQRINRNYKKCREKLNSQMVKFLLENEGVIDRWPSAENSVGIYTEVKDIPNLDKIEFPFAYFGDDYKPAGYDVYRENEFPVYDHDFYNPYETEELKAAALYKTEKHNQYFDQKARTGFKGGVKRFIALLPLILAVIFLAFSLFCYFKDVVPAIQVKEWVEEFSQIPAILLFIPKVILYVFAYISEILRFNNILFWIATLGISLFGIILGIKRVTSPKVSRVSATTLKKLWDENTDALEKYWAIEKEIKGVSKGWNNGYCDYLREEYRKN